MKYIGKYAKTKTDFEKFGVGSPDQKSATEMMLYSFALSNSAYITDEDIKNIDKRISDIVV